MLWIECALLGLIVFAASGDDSPYRGEGVGDGQLAGLALMGAGSWLLAGWLVVGALTWRPAAK